jgi:hypothetical protein
VFKLLQDFAVEEILSYESLNARKEEKLSTNELPPRGVQDSPLSFFCPTSRSSQESKGFVYRQATYKGKYGKAKEAVGPARAGLSPQEGDLRKSRKETGLSPQKGDMRRSRKSQEKKKTKEGKKGAPAKARFHVPLTKNSFFWFTSIWVWKWPILVEVSAPTRLGLQGSHVQRKFRKQTTLRSESSTLKGLLYAPIQQKQYLKRTTLRRLKIPLQSICSKEGLHYCLERSMSKKAVI